jgi:hypothetical protein
LLGTFLQSQQYVSAGASVSSAVSPTTKKRDDADGFVTSTEAARAPLPLQPSTWKALNNAVNVLSSLMAAALAVAVQHVHVMQEVQLLPFLVLVCALLLLTVTPGMRPVYAVTGCAVLTALWNLLYVDLPQQQRMAVLPLALAYVAWRVRG